MADTAIAITAGAGTNVDTRTEATNGNHRQVIVIGDPATNAGVAPVDATTGLAVNVTNASLTVASHAVTNAGTFAVQDAAAEASLSVLDDWDETDRAKVNIIVGQAGVDAGSGTGGSATPRVIIDSSQLSPLSTIAQAMTAGYQLVGLANDSPGLKAEDAASASGDVGMVVNAVRLDVPVANAGVSGDGDYTSLVLDNKRKLWVAGAYPEDTASADLDPVMVAGMRRTATPANQSGTDGDYEPLQGSAGALWTASAATDKTLLSERVINGGSQYETVAVSTTATLGATGATGDYLSHVICSPITSTCGVVTVLDNAIEVAKFGGGGTTALSNLVPFIIPIGMISVSGAWKITTGANITATGVGRFT